MRRAWGQGHCLTSRHANLPTGPTVVVQAFSHWTYVYSQRDFMVCDLQGELNVAGSEPFFELTDPCMHSKRGKHYGATDKGEKGMHEFFKTHHCNPACELVGIQNNRY